MFLMRAASLTALMFMIQLVVFCPCDRLLLCEDHLIQFAAANIVLGLSIAGDHFLRDPLVKAQG